MHNSNIKSGSRRFKFCETSPGMVEHVLNFVLTVHNSKCKTLILQAGAGDGNRTHVSSLGSSCSTIELHPQVPELLPFWRWRLGCQ